MKESLNSPIRLDSARAWRTYHGGKILDEMQDISPAADSHFPEDWIISTVRAINAGREDVVEGLNVVSGTQMTLKDVIAADPVAALGAAHVAKRGESPAVLVKLIDAAERLGVQGHPDKEMAMKLFHSPFGKTECWHIVGGREIGGVKPCVYMGFKPGITREKWRDVFDRQDIPAMLGLLHRIEVKPGDTFLIEGGMPHAIGAGCLLIEIQEPTDYTFRTERVTPQGFAIPEKACHYGIGFDSMFECFHYEGHDEAETRRLRMVPPRVVEETRDFRRVEVVGPRQTSCFQLERLEIAGEMRFAGGEGFCGLYVMQGEGELCGRRRGAPRMAPASQLASLGGCVATGRRGRAEERLRPGDQFFVPAAAEEFVIRAKSPLVVFKAKGET